MEELKITKWFLENCIPEYIKYKGKFDWYWCFRKDAKEAWAGVDDDTLKWFTNEEMVNNYRNIEKLKENQKSNDSDISCMTFFT